jgi:hypothetical protein
MSRLPSINHIPDENTIRTNRLFEDIQPIPELTDLGTISESRSQLNTPKSRPSRKSMLRNCAYEGSLQELENLTYPSLDPDQTMKNRISTLEAAGNTQREATNLACQTFRDVGVHVTNVEFAIRDLIQEVTSNYEVKLSAMKKEYDHR